MAGYPSKKLSKNKGPWGQQCSVTAFEWMVILAPQWHLHSFQRSFQENITSALCNTLYWEHATLALADLTLPIRKRVDSISSLVKKMGQSVLSFQIVYSETWHLFPRKRNEGHKDVNLWRKKRMKRHSTVETKALDNSPWLTSLSSTTNGQCDVLGYLPLDRSSEI